jgi:hypothetical protein
MDTTHTQTQTQTHTQHQNITRFDFVFSYWIFLWYMLYQFKVTSYNPKWALTIGIIENAILLFLLFYYNNPFVNIILFCFINFFIKVLPLWSLRKTKYEINGIYSLIVLFCIYLVWLKLNNVNINIQDSYKNIIHKKDIGPFTSYVKKLFNLN